MINTPAKTYPVFDCDAHVNEPLEIWQDYLSSAEQELVRDSYWQDASSAPMAILNGRSTVMGGYGAKLVISIAGPGMSKPTIRKLRMMDLRPEQLDYLEHKGVYDPKARIGDMDLMGIDQVLVIPTMINANFPFIENARAAQVFARAYNDWVHDYCSVVPQRLFPCGILPMQHPSSAANEVYRLAAKGFRVVLVRPIDANGNYPNSPSFDPVWRAVQECGLVLGMHAFPAGGGETQPANSRSQYSPGELIARAGRTPGIDQNLRSDTFSFIFEGMTWCTSMLLSGFLDRYRALRLAIFECNASWLPMMLDVCDQAAGLYRSERRIPLDRLPSDAFREQCVISFESDEKTLFRMHDYFADLGIWASDAYHSDGADAWSGIDLMNDLGVSQEHQEKLMGANARSMYGIEGRLFVTDRTHIPDRPDWWPTTEEVEAALSPMAAVDNQRRTWRVASSSR